MNLGQKINEFDNTDGTVKDFNKIFFKTPLEAHIGLVEIGNIYGTGSPSKRQIRLFTDGSERTIVHDFDNTCVDNQTLREAISRKGNRKNHDRYVYTAFDLDGKVLAEATNMVKLASKLGVTDATIKLRLKNAINKNTKVMSQSTAFNVTRRLK